jgi:hypothetical protein
MNITSDSTTTSQADISIGVIVGGAVGGVSFLLIAFYVIWKRILNQDHNNNVQVVREGGREGEKIGERAMEYDEDGEEGAIDILITANRICLLGEFHYITMANNMPNVVYDSLQHLARIQWISASFLSILLLFC